MREAVQTTPADKNDRRGYLRLDELAVNPKLARRLPADVAWRCHAIPLAEDRGRVTVAMADPGDTVAREMIVTALGPQACVVQGDPVAIDTLLATIWENKAQRPLNVQVCGIADPAGDEVWVYAQALGDLLGARVSCLDTVRAKDKLVREGTKCDLVVLGRKDQSLIHRILSQAVKDEVTSSDQGGVPFGVLVAGRPRWPLENLLLVLWGAEADEAALDWVMRLARPSGSAVTVLAVMPPVPAMYDSQAGRDQGLAALLASATPLASQMRQATQRLVDWEIAGILRLHQGPPDLQICREIVKGDYDLIALAAKHHRWWLRWLGGDLVGALLHRTDRPVLIARPRTA